MTSRRLLVLALTLSILGTVVVAWATTRWWWLNQPVPEAAQSARIELVQQAAEAMRAGRTMQEVERDLGIDLRRDVGPPEGPPTGPPPRTGLFVRLPYTASWSRVAGADGVWERPGPERELAAWAGPKWIILHDDAVPPGLGLLGLFLLTSAPLLVGVVILTGRAMSPVEAAEQALERMRAGELERPLDEEAGPPELRRMARAVNALAAQTRRLVERERQRMAGLSHEMRTPLTRIRLELELARRAGAEPERIARVEAEVEALDGLVRELLELARLEGRRSLEAETVDLRGLVESVLDDEGEGEVEVRGDGFARVDPRLLRRALANLLRNSRQHAPGASRWVTVGPGRLEVGDDGPGLEAGLAERAFDVFWRGPGRTDGHGLGLAIVQEVVQAHGGAIAIESVGGFVVRMELPEGDERG